MAKISIIGDLTFNGLFCIDAQNNRERLSDVAEILKKCDYVFANLEAFLKGENIENPEKLKKGGVIHFTEKEILASLSEYLHIGTYSLANNHCYDYTKSGLEETIITLKKLDIKYTGAGTNEFHIKPVIVSIENTKIGFIAYVDKSTNPKIPSNSGIYVNYLEESQVLHQIREIKPLCDIIIVSLHWGVDYSRFPTIEQQRLAKLFVDAGAKIIMGHHPHTLQTYERYKDSHIFYSLGSICHGDYEKDGGLRALRISTKHSIITVYDTENDCFEFIKTRELKGNWVKLCKTQWKNNVEILKLKNKYTILNSIILFREVFIDRLYDFFFGYYRNPIKQIFRFSNLKKIKYFFEDYKRMK